MRFTELLVKYRTVFLVTMTALAIVCGAMIPRINVVMELSFFLPDDSPMKIGIDRIAEDFPDMNGQLNMLSVMLENVEDKDAEEKVLSELTGNLLCVSVKENSPYTLYQFLLSQTTDSRACERAIQQHYGDSAVIEIDLDKNMPAGIPAMILTGFIMVFISLLIMCSSVMEVLLFLLTTGIAVAINMGSNILLDGVSYLTTTMVGVLQMILSMDYSIIIMNRYRQEKKLTADSQKAMAKALASAAPSVMSSALTTIVSLLMLIFMHLKIGLDMGFILSKGVLLSMICNFTVLPGFILLFEKAIHATEKKVPLLPSAALARFEVRYRAVLAVALVGIFTAAFILQKRTEVSFAAIWETEISKKFPPQNPMVMLYDTADEDVVPALLDSLGRDPKVTTCVSYPSLMKQKFTAAEITQRFDQVASYVPEEFMRIIYYAYTHPERKERLSLNEIQDLSKELSAKGMIPDGFDVEGITKKLMQAPAPVKVTKPEPKPEPVPVADTLIAAIPDSTALAQAAVPDSLDAQVTPADSTETASKDIFTYEQVTQQLTARQMSELYGIERSYLNMLYRMAGRTRKPATMSPYEAATFINTRVLPDKRYANMVTPEMKQQFRDLYVQLDSVFLAGPSVMPQEDDLLADNVLTADSLSAAAAVTDSVALAKAEPVAVSVPEPEEEDEYVEPTPLERLAEMAFSGKKYNSRTVRRALVAAGVPVSQSDMDLLYLYAGSRKWSPRNTRLSINELVHFVDSSIIRNPAFAPFIDDNTRTTIEEVKDQLDFAATSLRSERSSVATVLTDFEFESPETFAFVDRFRELADKTLNGEHYLIGESMMYKDIKDEFPSELLLLTILTISAIFVIVALTFKSFIIPIMLILAVMTGVYVNVFVSGLGGNTMYFMAYLIVQSILMGATIDYSILFTSYYRESRLKMNVADSIAASYLGAGHSIMTSGLILTVAPFVMSFIIEDQMVATILKCLGTGALSAVLVIFLVLPGVIALCDKVTAPKGAVKSFGNK